jgi:hypothetical protein
MKLTILCLLALPGAYLAGCSSRDEPAPKRPEKTILDPLLKTEQRARDVQKSLDQSASQARRSVAAQEKGDAEP